MKGISLIMFWLLSFNSIFSQYQFYALPDKNSSDEFGILPYWISNPLSLKGKDTICFTATATPSRFLVKDLNSVSTQLVLPVGKYFNSAFQLGYLGTDKFSYSSFRIDIQKSFFNKFNLAGSFMANMFTIPTFSFRLYPDLNLFLEYFAFDEFNVSFCFKNLFNLNPLSNNIAGFGTLIKLTNFFAFGLDVNVFLKQFTSLTFNSDFIPFENFCFSVSATTIPPVVHISAGYRLHHYFLSFHFQYHNYLGVLQTFSFSYEF